MELAVLFFLTSGLFLGWSLGANDAANVFGTAVGTQMVRFTTAAIICSVFVILGAVISGAGAAHTLGRLGAVNTLSGSFMAALSAAVSVYAMTKLGLPVSTTQAIVGAILGWNLYSETRTDLTTLTTILSTWIICPVLAAVFSIILFKVVNYVLKVTKPHMLRSDAYTRLGLLLAGAFGAYSLGANNIANVMGVFIPSSPFTDFSVAGLFSVSSTQQLFLLGALAIAVGVVTYSKRVMMTVGGRLLPLSPVAAWVVVVAHSLVLFVFASEGLEALLLRAGLPTIPLVPVSSSQAVVGAVIGIGILKSGRSVQWNVLGSIGMGWVATPIMAGVLCFVGLFFLQNVFNQTVYRPIPYTVSEAVVEHLDEAGVPVAGLQEFRNRSYGSAREFAAVLEEIPGLTAKDRDRIMVAAEIDEMFVDVTRFNELDQGWLTHDQLEAAYSLASDSFRHPWQLAEALAAESPDWRLLEDTRANKAHNKDLQKKLDSLYRAFRLRR
ncbi:MAG: inorganic phosphate transporter [Kiloniellales bacterium]